MSRHASIQLGRCAAAALAALAAVLAPGRAKAIELDFFEGRVRGSFDTTLTSGLLLRASERDEELIGIVNGGEALSVNGDDGNLNYDQWDPVSSQLRATHELALRWRNLAVFARAFYFYDPVIQSTATDRTPLGDLAKRRAGLRIQPLDAYATFDFDAGNRPVTVRFGNQVISWGESTFIQNGINVINPFDVTSLRVAGAEIRNALRPVPALDVSIGLSDRLSIEGYYQLYWEPTELEPLGTFFSTSDIGSEGARWADIGFGLNPDDPVPPFGTTAPIGTVIPRAKDRDPPDFQEGGVALRWFEPRLWGSEFGLYYIRYHSRVPVISAVTGTLAGFNAGDYARSARYFREYPEDIDLFGWSFSTELGSTGIAMQGEVSYRLDQPLQIDDVELLLAGFTPLPIVGDIVAGNQVGVFGFNDYIQGYRRKDVLQPQITLTKLFGPMLGADQLLLLAEVGATLVQGMEDKEDFRYEGPGTHTSGDPTFTEAGIQPRTQNDGFADARSWGYRIVVRPTYNRAIGPVNLEPTVAFQHDVQGTTPLPIANFVDRRKAISLALRGVYLERFTAEVGYTNFWGGREFNLLRDRDFVSVAFSYSF